MPTVVETSPKTWNGEPAAYKSLIVAVLATVLSILTGQTTGLDGANAIAVSVVTFAFPLVAGLWIRQSVSPVQASTVAAQKDAK